MDKTPSAVLLWIDPLIGGTKDMSDEEFGVYLRILIQQCKTPSGVKLSFIQSLTGKRFKRLWPSLKSKFIESEPDVFYNEKMRKEILKSLKHSDVQSAKANKRWKPTMPGHPPNNAGASHVPMPGHVDNDAGASVVTMPGHDFKNAAGWERAIKIKEDTNTDKLTKKKSLSSCNQEEQTSQSQEPPVSPVVQMTSEKNLSFLKNSPQKNIDEMQNGMCIVPIKLSVSDSEVVSFHDLQKSVTDHIKNFLGQGCDDIAFWCHSFLGPDVRTFTFAMNMYIAEVVALGQEQAPNMLKKNFTFFVTTRRRDIMTAYQNSQRDKNWFDTTLGQHEKRFTSPESMQRFREYYTKIQPNGWMYFHTLNNFDMLLYISKWNEQKKQVNGSQVPAVIGNSHLDFASDEDRDKFYKNGGF